MKPGAVGRPIAHELPQDRALRKVAADHGHRPAVALVAEEFRPAVAGAAAVANAKNLVRDDVERLPAVLPAHGDRPVIGPRIFPGCQWGELAQDFVEIDYFQV